MADSFSRGGHDGYAGIGYRRRRASTLAIPKIAMRNASESHCSFDDRCINRIDLVLLMDVIEHVEDDVCLVREYVQKVAPGNPIHCDGSCVYVVVERSRRAL